MIDVNLTGVFHCCKFGLEIMRDGGAIVCVGSLAAKLGFHGQSNYAAAKAGVQALVRVLARECARRKIRVNAVAPGRDRHGDDGIRRRESARAPGQRDRAGADGPARRGGGRGALSCARRWPATSRDTCWRLMGVIWGNRNEISTPNASNQTCLEHSWTLPA